MPQRFEKKTASLILGGGGGRGDLGFFKIGGEVDLGLFEIKGVKYKSFIFFFFCRFLRKKV